MKMNIEARQKFIDAVKKLYGSKETITREEVLKVVNKYRLPFPNWLTVDKSYRVGRGVYSLTLKTKEKNKVRETKTNKSASISVASVPTLSTTIKPAEAVPFTETQIDLIPKKAEGYVPFGHFNDLEKIIDSKLFYPVYVTGLSGNGKTMMAEQVHAYLNREVIRVNVTIETDEDDLLGGFRLMNGQTVWQNGPVIIAMLRGATLILDEVDLGSNKIMCLQPVLEGNGIFLKKINKFIKPARGFNIIATANTKGKGSEDGRFMGTNILNEAFLERFSITMEQEYPPEKTEIKILNNVLKLNGVEDIKFTTLLTMWAAAIRETFMQGAITEIISTRRLVHICQAYSIFNKDRKKAIELCLSRFDSETKISMMQAYEKLDETINPIKKEEVIATPPQETSDNPNIPF